MRLVRLTALLFFSVCLIGIIRDAHAYGEGASRIGVSIGGVHILGLYYEYHYTEDAAVRAQVGYMIHAVSLNLSSIWYAGDSRHRPYVGLGVQKHLVGRHFAGTNIICLPVGVDAEIAERHYLGLELIPAVSLSSIGEPKEEKAGFFDYFFPLPIVSYKYLTE